VFLRLTEYYQGILFLTTNRVETFDEAFQSRIHMGIRYDNLKPAARKKIWQHHVSKVEKMAAEECEDGKGNPKVKPFTDDDFNELSKKNMNGRQVRASRFLTFIRFTDPLVDQEHRENRTVNRIVRRDCLLYGTSEACAGGCPSL
jgi:SpoVK/Ycf46/Vps4 family AAA+-type ATPase